MASDDAGRYCSASHLRAGLRLRRAAGTQEPGTRELGTREPGPGGARRQGGAAEQTDVIGVRQPDQGQDEAEEQAARSANGHAPAPPRDQGRVGRPDSGWRGALFSASGGLINPGVGRAEVARAGLVRRIRGELSGPLEVMVCSLKGGVGKTTVAACLGLVLAEHRSERVVVLDADPHAGTLADRLTGGTGRSMRKLINDIDRIDSPTAVTRYTGEAGGLHVIAGDQDPATGESFDGAEYERICALLTRYYDIVITDCGSGLAQSTMNTAISRTGALVVVGTPTVDGASRAAKTLDWLRANGHAEKAADAVVVLCRDQTSEQIHRDRLITYFAARCRAVVEIPHDPTLAVGGRIDPTAIRDEVWSSFLRLGALVVEPDLSTDDPGARRPPPPPPPSSRRPDPGLPRRRAEHAPAAPRHRTRRRGRRVLVAVGITLALLAGGLAGVAFVTQNASPPAAAAAVPPPEAAPPPEPELPAAPLIPAAAPAIAPSVPIPTLGAPIAAGATPAFVAATPDGQRAYVANADAKAITVVDTATNQVSTTIPVEAGPPQFLSFSPDGRRLYISIFNEQRTIAMIGVLDTTTNQMVATVPVRTRPFASAVTRDGKRLYVPNHDSGSISVIDTATNAVIKDIKVAANPHWIDMSHDGTRAYMANHESNLICVLDLATDNVIARIRVPTSPHSVAVHPTRPLLANVNYDANSATFIDTNTNQVIATVPVGRNPQAITWAPDGRFAYTVNNTDGTVSVIDADGFRVTATIHTGNGPTSVAVLPNGRGGYVTNLDGQTVSVLHPQG
ncbi:AAA family ATPase [Pseudonocardia acaciae]|uniref:YVTN family beta-propeller repeat protein n=1 Tax=Pseudonocardia acaciae TaxID=551276 RepID=UPI00146FE8A8|nr:AAA family ATPase [Pseudonocardia acaciae]